MKQNKFKTLAAAATFVGLFGFTSYAQAIGTLAGVNVDNIATVNYQVEGTNQAEVESSPTGNTTSGAGNGVSTRFVVDRVARLTVVAESTTPVEIPAGFNNTALPVTPDYALAFDVTNTGNGTQDLALNAINHLVGDAGDGVTDEFDSPNAFIIYEDTNGNDVLDAGDAVITFIDEAAADSVHRIFVVGSTPSGQTVGDNESVTLVARLHEAGGAAALGAVTAESASDTHNDNVDSPAVDLAEVDVVLGDALALDGQAVPVAEYGFGGSGTVDTARNGQHADTAHYVIIGTTITVTKTSEVFSDPFNGETNPKRIPGAIVRYTISVQNNGSLDAESVVISDEIPDNTVYLENSVTITGNSGGLIPGATAEPDDVDPEVTYDDSGSPATLSVQAGTVPNNTTTTITFDVTIQ